MCGNRVEELEARVNELEASVEGLTDELVECKVRLRELENTVDEDIGFAADDSDSSDPESVAETANQSSSADSTKQTDGKNKQEQKEADADSDIIVA